MIDSCFFFFNLFYWPSLAATIFSSIDFHPSEGYLTLTGVINIIRLLQCLRLLLELAFLLE